MSAIVSFGFMDKHEGYVNLFKNATVQNKGGICYKITCYPLPCLFLSTGYYKQRNVFLLVNLQVSPHLRKGKFQEIKYFNNYPLCLIT